MKIGKVLRRLTVVITILIYLFSLASSVSANTNNFNMNIAPKIDNVCSESVNNDNNDNVEFSGSDQEIMNYDKYSSDYVGCDNGTDTIVSDNNEEINFYDDQDKISKGYLQQMNHLSLSLQSESVVTDKQLNSSIMNAIQASQNELFSREILNYNNQFESQIQECEASLGKTLYFLQQKSCYSEDISGKYSNDNQLYTYNGSINVQIILSKSIVAVQKNNDITITAKSADGTPVQNVLVRLYGSGMDFSGYTDVNGECRASIRPSCSGSIELYTNGEYMDRIYAVSDNEGIVKVRGKDMQGVQLHNVSIMVLSNTRKCSSNSLDGQATAFANAGKNKLIFTGISNQQNSYYVVKNVDIIPGTINELEIDMSQEGLVEANLSFNYANNNIDLFNIGIANKDWVSEDIIASIGGTDINNPGQKGCKRIYLTPGNYEVIANSYNSEDILMHLVKNGIDIRSNGVYPVSWAASETGILRYNVTGANFPANNIELCIDGMWIPSDIKNEVILDNGQHNIYGVKIQTQTYNENRWYAFWKSENNTVTVNSDQQIFDINLGMKSIGLYRDRSTINLGQAIHYWVCLKTNSEYELFWSDTDLTMNTEILKPDGTKVVLKNQDFHNGNYATSTKDPQGLYSINSTIDFGMLYGYKLFMSTFSTLNKTIKPIVTVDNHLMKVGVNNEVTITVKNIDGTPLPNQQVMIFGNIQLKICMTDGNGQCKVLINPSGHGNISIFAGNYFYDGLLFAVCSDEGLVRVTANSVEGIGLTDFYINVSSQSMGWGISGTGMETYTLAKQGQNELTFLSSGYPDGYFIIKNIDVKPWQVNDFCIDTSQEQLVKARLNFKYNSDPIAMGSIDIISQNSRYNPDKSFSIGNSDDLGYRNIFISPGIYKFNIHGVSLENKPMCLYKENCQISKNGMYPISWIPAEVGKLSFKYTGITLTQFSKYMELNNMYINFSNSDEILINKGLYKVNSFGVEGMLNGSFIHYDFKKPDEQENEDILVGDLPYIFNKDLGIKSIELKLYTKDIKPGSYVKFSAEVVTNSDYIIEGYPYFTMYFTVESPLGSSSSSCPISLGSYYLPDSSPEGAYTIMAQVLLGPCYDIYYPRISFTVRPRPNVSVSKTIVNVNQPTDVTLTVTDSNGLPLQNEKIVLKGHNGYYNECYSDVNGNVTISVNSSVNQEISVSAGGYEYRQMIYVLEPNTGLVEIRAKDINGNDLNNLDVNVRGSNMTWGTYNSGIYTRAIACGGSNALSIICRSSNSGEIYCILKDINVTPGEINYISYIPDDIDNKLLKTTLNFNYDTSLACDYGVYLQKTNDNFLNSYSYLGSTDLQGNINVYMTPGMYKAMVQKNEGQKIICLSKDNVQIISGSTQTISWDDTETGSLFVNIFGLNNQVENKTLQLGAQNISLYNANEIILNKGQYRVSSLNILCGDVYYNLYKSFTQQDIVTIGSNPQMLNIDLSINTPKIILYTKNILHPGETINFGVPIKTNSGYVFSKVYGGIQNSFVVNKPDGSLYKPFCTNYLDNIPYIIDQNASEGKHIINAAIDLGPLYGVYNLSNEFYIVNSTEFKVYKTTPGNNEIDINPNSCIEILLTDEIMNYDRDRIMLVDNLGNAVQINSLVVNLNSLVIKCDSGWQFGKTYNLTIYKDALTSVSGQNMNQYFSLTFTVKAGSNVNYGNVDGDSDIDYSDSQTVKNAVLNKTQLLTENGKAAADVDGDGKITSTDYALILRYLAGKISKFPIEN